jgi:hypothetical protein
MASNQGELMRRRILIGVGAIVGLAVVAAVGLIGPRNIIGMWRYDIRAQGSYREGDLAPDVALLSLDADNIVHLRDVIGKRPLVLVFGSFT